MATCSWCGGPDDEGLGKCSKCFGVLAPATTKAAPVITYEAATPSTRSLISWLPIKSLLYVTVLLAILNRDRISQYFFKPVPLGSITLIDASNGTSGSICATHDSCVLVYVAPWCPSCVEHIDLAKAMVKAARRRPGKGVEIIIGMDERPSLEAMAERFYGRVWLDVNHTFATTLGVRSIPTLLKVKGGAVVEKFGFPMVTGESEEDLANKVLDYAL